jgi:hypothetical protein
MVSRLVEGSGARVRLLVEFPGADVPLAEGIVCW